METPGIYSFTIYQGATYDQTFLWNDANGNPVDLTGAAAHLQVRPKYGSDILIVDCTVDNGRIILGGTDGTIRVLIDADTTGDILQSGVYDLKVIFPDGTVDRPLQGNVSWSQEVTS